MTAVEMPPAVPVDVEEHVVDEHKALVDYYVQRQRAQDEARRIVRQDRAGALPEASFEDLSALLAVEDDPVRWRVAELWPVEGRVVYAAQYKAGKSTTVGNLLRSLADGDPFLDHFAVTRPAGRIALIDNELGKRRMRQWLREQGIVNTAAVTTLDLRGKAAAFDVLDPEVRARWASDLRGMDVSVLVLDCLRPIIDALGLDESKDTGKVLVAFDALLVEAAIPEAVVVHHMGHNGERSRGDSRLRDWPDVEWTLVRQEEDPASPRFFKAYGRDVDVAEGQLGFEPAARRMTWLGGTRKDAAADEVLPDVLEYLEKNPGATQNAVEKALSQHRRAELRTALRRAEERGLVDVQEGPRHSRLHFRSLTAPTAPAPRQRGDLTAPTASIGAVAVTDEVDHCAAAQSEPERVRAQDLGPCTRCHTTTVRYGDAGHALCARCQRAGASS